MVSIGKNSNLIEGAYVTTVMSRKGIRPYDEGLSNLTNDNMVEGFSVGITVREL